MGALLVTPDQFFRELVVKAQKKHRYRFRPDTEFYLVKLLTNFIDTNRLYAVGEDGHPQDEPLAIQFLKAETEALSPHEKGLSFRRLGDIALYVSGFFSDSFSRKAIDVDYYIQMGATCYYRAAGHHSDKPPYPQILEDLAINFSRAVDILNEVADSSKAKGPDKDKALLRWYELWTKTGSERLAKLLRKNGIEPSDAVKSKYQV